MRIPTALILGAAAFAAATAPASGAVTSTYAAGTDTLTVESDAAADTMVVACQANALLVNGANPTSGALPCSAPSTVVVLGQGGSDTLDVKGLEGQAYGAVTADGGDGDDQVTGVYLASNGQVVSLAGGPGADTLTSNTSDVMRGGPGDDRLAGAVQEGGTLDGEDGTDTFAFSLAGATPVSFTFTLNATGMTIGAPGVAQTQTLPFTSIEAADLVLGDGAETVDGKAFPGSLRVDGRGGADSLVGTAAADTLIGGEGNDFLDGVGGADSLLAGGGLDLVHARDGVADTGDCGTEEDTLVAVGRRAGGTVRVRLGAVTFQLAGGASKTFTRRVPRKRVRALKRLERVRLKVVLDVVDAAGNRTQGTTRIRLRR